jgi:regulatory protein
VERRSTKPRTRGAGDQPAEPDDPLSAARAVVLRQLAMAPRSRAQLADTLARKGFDPSVAEQVLDRFEEVDLVDDDEFARQWVHTRHTGRGLARRALSHELRTRGVDDETVRAAVDAIDDDTELEAARELVRRRLRSMTGDDPARRTRRLAGMLARKGYGSGVAMRAIRDCVAEAEDELFDAVGDGVPEDDDGLDTDG